MFLDITNLVVIRQIFIQVSTWVSGKLVVESYVDNEWIERSGKVTVAIYGGINLREPSTGDVTNPTSLPIICRLDFEETFGYDKFLIKKSGHAFVRQSINSEFIWLDIGSTVNSLVTSYWVSGIEI